MDLKVPIEFMDKDGHYLYLISSTLNDRVYVGITNKLRKRFCEHARCMRRGVNKSGSKSHLYSTAKKHGLDKFTFSLVAVFDTRVSLTKAEIDLIAKYKSDGVVMYNMTDGGDGSLGLIPSPETRAKLSKATKGQANPMYGRRGVLSPLYGRRRCSRPGDKNPMYGKTHTAEARAKVSKANTKYAPELISVYQNCKDAMVATGISQAGYYYIKKAHPHLFNKER